MIVLLVSFSLIDIKYKLGQLSCEISYMLNKIPNILNDISRMSYKINNMTFVSSISDIL